LHGGSKVGAAADRLGEEYIGVRIARELFRRVREGIEPAAETSAGDLLHRIAVRFHHGCIDESVALIVRDQAHPSAPRRQVVRQAQHRRGFSGSKKAADHDVAGSGHQR
jgi:hypothetical protein